MQSETKHKSAAKLFVAIITAALLLFVAWQVLGWLKSAYIYWSNYQTVEVHVIRREKARLDVENTEILSDDYSPDTFYILTEELGWLRTDIYGFDHIGLGKEVFDITRKESGGEWWIVKDYSIPKPTKIEDD